jgi:hypothetical protein
MGAEFAASPGDMFGPDQFHPSTAGYKSCAAAMLPTVAAAVGVTHDETAIFEPARGEGVFTLARAAVVAADSTGTEISRADVAGGDHGPRGRWALLRHRRRHAIPDVGDIVTAPDASTAEPVDR